MTADQFSKIVVAAQRGDTAAFNQFFHRLYQDCRVKLLRYAPNAVDAEEAFAETVCKFWQTFVIDQKPLPQDNLKGYIFTMAKFYCIDRQRQRQRHRIVAEGGEEKGEWQQTEQDYLDIEQQSENYKIALRNGIQQLGDRCRRIFEYMLEHNTIKPREVWKGLGYNNARTFSSIKSECQKKLKVKVAAALEKLEEE